MRSSVTEFSGAVSNDMFSVKVPLHGVENYTIGREVYSVKPGQFLIVRAGEDVYGEAKSPSAVEGLCFYLSCNQVHGDEIDNQVAVQREKIRSEIYHMGTDPLSIALHAMSEENLSQWSEEDFLTLTHLVYDHQYDENARIEEILAKKTSTKLDLRRRLLVAWDVIQEDYASRLTLDEIARESCISKYYLVRHFKNYYGHTPYQALMNRRLYQATVYLMDGSNIDDVSLSCGFDDRRNFSRQFKKRYKMTPMAYRKKMS